MVQTKKQSWYSQQLPFRLHQFRFFLVEQSASGSPSHMGFQSVRFFMVSPVVYHNSFRNDTGSSDKSVFLCMANRLPGEASKKYSAANAQHNKCSRGTVQYCPRGTIIIFPPQEVHLQTSFP